MLFWTIILFERNLKFMTFDTVQPNLRIGKKILDFCFSIFFLRIFSIDFFICKKCDFFGKIFSPVRKWVVTTDNLTRLIFEWFPEFRHFWCVFCYNFIKYWYNIPLIYDVFGRLQGIIMSGFLWNNHRFFVHFWSFFGEFFVVFWWIFRRFLVHFW